MVMEMFFALLYIDLITDLGGLQDCSAWIEIVTQFMGNGDNHGNHIWLNN